MAITTIGLLDKHEIEVNVCSAYLTVDLWVKGGLVELTADECASLLNYLSKARRTLQSITADVARAAQQ